MQNKTKFGLGLGGNSYFTFPLVSTFSITDDSTVSEYPVVDRIQIVDHKYDNPRVISLTTTISNHHNLEYYPTIENRSIVNKTLFDKNNYLRLVGEFFTRLKRESWIVSVITPSTTIKNCIITSIAWNDSGQHAEVTLSFKEIYTYLLEEVKEVTNPGDPNLPYLADAMPQDFVANVLLKNSQELDAIIAKTLYDAKLLEESFIAVVGTLSAAGIVIAGVITLGVVIGIISAGVGVLLSIPVVGLVIVALTAVAGLIYGVYKLISEWLARRERRRIYYEEFRKHNDAGDMKREIARYNKVVKSIYDGILNLNNVITSYTIPSNVKQVININIGGNDYQMFIEPDETSLDKWTFTLKDYDDKVLIFEDNEEKKVEKVKIEPLKSYFLADNKNAAYSENGYKLHFTYDLKHIKDIYPIDSKGNPLKDVKPKLNLEHLQVNITNIDLSEFKEIIKKATLTAMKRK